MRTQLGSFVERVNVADWSVTVGSGGNLTTAGTINLHLSLVNRVGLNLLSIPIATSYNPGDKITITINSSIIRDGEDIHAFIISGQTTGNNADAVQLAEIPYREEFDTGNFTVETLPLTLELTEDSHLETVNTAIASEAEYPTVPVNGMLRELNGQWQRYKDSTWIPHYFTTNSTYLTSTLSDRGADQSLGASAIIPPPIKTGNNDSVKVRFWLVNDASDGAIIAAGTQLQLLVAVNGELFSDAAPEGYASKLSGLVRYRLAGYYRLLDNAFNSSVADVGLTKTWRTWEPIVIPADLDSGNVAVYDFWLSYSESEIAGKGIGADDYIGFGLKVGLDGNTTSSLSPIYCDNFVFNSGQNLVVVPSKLLSGYAIVNGLDFRVNSFYPLAGLQSDTANQLVLLNPITQSVRVDTTATADEQVRATVSTEGGFGQVSPQSDLVTLADNENLEITFNHPISGGKGTIRPDYPDEQIKGNNQADWNNPDIRLFVRQGGQWHQKNNLIGSTAHATQTFTVSDLADFIAVPGVPDGLAGNGTDFGLFAPLKADVASSGTGSNLAGGAYQVVWYYEYPLPNSKITKINHTANGAIAFEGTNQGKVYPDTLTLVQAKALAVEDLEDGLLYVVHNNGYNLYSWDAASTDAASDYLNIEVTGIATGRLRLVGTPKPNYSNGTNSYSQPTLEFDGDRFTVAEDATNEKVAIAFKPDPNQYQIGNLIQLKALDVANIADNSPRLVIDISGSDPDYQFYYAYYYWDSTSTLTVAEPAVVAPDSVIDPATEPGRWISTQLPIIDNAIPAIAPEQADKQYRAILSNPDRTVIWRSPLSLPTTPVVSDWIPSYEPIAISLNGAPAFNAEFLGQLVVDTDTGSFYRATDLTGTWQST